MLDKSYAKINLFLRIFKKDPGYHLLDSAFAFLDIFDQIEIERSDQFKINISGQYQHFVDPAKSVFTDIAQHFQEKYSLNDNVAINLVKNIPVGSGLGGGSSNGAKLIEYFNEEYELGLTFPELQKISFEFGSDIAFFLQGKAAIVKNRGEVIGYMQKFEPIEVALIVPDFGLSTKDVFAKFDGDFSEELDAEKLGGASATNLINNYQNDLQSAAFAVNPRLKEIYDCAAQSSAKIVKMSGSGSIVFAIFSDEDYDKGCLALRVALPDCEIVKSKIKWEIDHV